MLVIPKDTWKLLEAQYKILEVEPRIHGSPFDRGCADAYYHRSPSPHYWTNENGLDDERVEELTEKQRGEYISGYVFYPERKMPTSYLNYVQKQKGKVKMNHLVNQ